MSPAFLWARTRFPSNSLFLTSRSNPLPRPSCPLYHFPTASLDISTIPSRTASTTTTHLPHLRRTACRSRPAATATPHILQSILLRRPLSEYLHCRNLRNSSLPAYLPSPKECNIQYRNIISSSGLQACLPLAVCLARQEHSSGRCRRPRGQHRGFSRYLHPLSTACPLILQTTRRRRLYHPSALHPPTIHAGFRTVQQVPHLTCR